VQLVAEGIEREPAAQAPFFGDADLAALLADDDHEGIALLGQAQRRTVTGSERVGEVLVAAQRKNARGGDDLVIADDDGSIVMSRQEGDDAAN